MKLTVKVIAQEDPQPGKTYESIIDQFELVINGDSQRFTELVSKIIGIIPPQSLSIQKASLSDDFIIDAGIPGSII